MEDDHMEQNNKEKQQRQLSPEELQQTQVINLKDLEEVVRFEKRTSKNNCRISNTKTFRH